MECPKCGTYNRDVAKFCGECGTNLNQLAESKSSSNIDNVQILRSQNVTIDQSTKQYAEDPKAKRMVTASAEKCPICGRVVKDDYFQCFSCKRDFIHPEHMKESPDYYKESRYLCIDCYEQVEREHQEELQHIEAEENARMDATTIHEAAANGDIELLEIFLKYGTDIDEKDEDGKTALHWAVENCHTETVSWLVEHGANIEAKDNYNFTPLHHGAENGHTKVVSLLLEHGADIEAKNRMGSTVLHIAVCGEDTETVALLVENGAEINVKNNFGETPLDLAMQEAKTHPDNPDYQKIIQILKYAGAK